jgi:hypothetical protein
MHMVSVLAESDTPSPPLQSIFDSFYRMVFDTRPHAQTRIKVTLRAMVLV